jgi:lysylphosphatidylglycerol synthetase-like protein (DUF2156 family)
MVRKKAVRNSEENKKIDYGIVSFILGIVAIVEAFISPFTGVILSIIGLSFLNKTPIELRKKSKRLNIIALVIGAILVILSLILTYTTIMSGLGAY